MTAYVRLLNPPSIGDFAHLLTCLILPNPVCYPHI